MKIFIKIWHVIDFVFFYMKRVIKSNIQIAHDILTPTFYMKPAIVEVPVKLKKDYEILALANLITMTPGTLSMELTDDKKKLFVHVMYFDDKEKFFKRMEELENNIHKLLN